MSTTSKSQQEDVVFVMSAYKDLPIGPSTLVWHPLSRMQLFIFYPHPTDLDVFDENIDPIIMTSCHETSSWKNISSHISLPLQMCKLLKALPITIDLGNKMCNVIFYIHSSSSTLLAKFIDDLLTHPLKGAHTPPMLHQKSYMILQGPCLTMSYIQKFTL